MGQKINPIANRLGFIRGWDSNWYDSKSYAAKLYEDERIRKYINARIDKGGISRLIIERTIKHIIITIYTSRPGIIIGKGGKEVETIREELKQLTSKDVQINIAEVKRPELDSQLVGENIARQIESRVSYKRIISGRLNGNEIARTEQFKQGRVPLHTFRADIDYALVEANTVYGKIGLKVFICKGEVLGKRDLSPNIGLGKSKPKRPRKRF